MPRLGASGNTAAGAVIGAGVGAVTGAAIGASEDRNRALIALRYHCQIGAGAVTIADVINMTRAGVDEGLIINQIRTHGMAQVVRPDDLVILQQQAVSPQVVAVMQSTPPQAQAVIVEQSPPPVIVEERPDWHRGYYYRY